MTPNLGNFGKGNALIGDLAKTAANMVNYTKVDRETSKKNSSIHSSKSPDLSK